VAFIIYAASDFLAWRNLYRETLLEWTVRRQVERVMSEEPGQSTPDAAERQVRRKIQGDMERELRRGLLFSFTGPVSFLRSLFEFGLPLLYGIFAIWILLFMEPPPADGASLDFVQALSA
jgi:hypothetical protein